MTAVAIHTPHDLANAVNRVQSRSRRSKQRKVGASSLGTCRRQTAYVIAGTPKTDEKSMMAAALGTWIHKGALDVMKREYGAITEVRLENDLFRSSADAYFPDIATVEDLKTKGRFVYQQAVEKGPRISEMYQTTVYAWLLREGAFAKVEKRLTGPQDVENIVVRFLNRDTGEDFAHQRSYDPALTAEALGWLADVLDGIENGGPEAVPRDLNGPGVSIMCDYCPFRTACWGASTDGIAPQALLVISDAEIEEALTTYATARDEIRPWTEAKDFARAQLDKKQRAIYGDMFLGWQGGKTSEKADLEAMIQFYEEAGIAVPKKQVTSPITIQVRKATDKDRKEAAEAQAARDELFGADPVFLDGIGQ